MELLKKIFFHINSFFKDVEDAVLVLLLKIAELHKFQDKRRKKIYKTFSLNNDQKQLVNRFYKKYYGRAIPLIWHRYYSTYTNSFDYCYFPELLFIPEFEHFMNKKTDYVNVFADKNIIPFIAAYAQVKTPEVVCSCTNGLLRDNQYHLISKEQAIELINNKGSMFYKPTIDSNSGQGCKIIEYKDGIELNTKYEVEELFNSDKRNWVIQRIIICNDTLRKLSPNSVNTFRIMTYVWKGQIYTTPSILRIGRNNSFLDNAHAGGLFLAIHNDGTLGKEAFTEFQERFIEHPDTHILFEKYKIKEFPTVLELAKRIHELIPQIGIINWDFTIDDANEPVLIEANTSKGGIWVFQMAHGKGPFGDNTKDILCWLKQEKKKAQSKR